MIRVSPNSSTRHRSIDNDDEELPMKTKRGLDDKIMSTSNELTSLSYNNTMINFCSVDENNDIIVMIIPKFFYDKCVHKTKFK